MSLRGVMVGGYTGAANSGHGGAGVGTTGKDGVRAVEAGRGVEAGSAGPGVELVSSSGSEVE